MKRSSLLLTAALLCCCHQVAGTWSRVLSGTAPELQGGTASPAGEGQAAVQAARETVEALLTRAADSTALDKTYLEQSEQRFAQEGVEAVNASLAKVEVAAKDLMTQAILEGRPGRALRCISQARSAGLANMAAAQQELLMDLTAANMEAAAVEDSVTSRLGLLGAAAAALFDATYQDISKCDATDCVQRLRDQAETYKKRIAHMVEETQRDGTSARHKFDRTIIDELTAARKNIASAENKAIKKMRRC